MHSPQDTSAQIAALSRAVTVSDEGATEALAMRFGAALQCDDVVYLSGPLGAGKTTFVRGVLAGWGGQAIDVSSPTYALVHVYDAPRGPLVHVDLYRLAAADEAVSLELEHWLARAPILIEWAERAAGVLPPSTWRVTLTPAATPQAREVTIQRL